MKAQKNVTAKKPKGYYEVVKGTPGGNVKKPKR
jgi:hypothetical protein